MARQIEAHHYCSHLNDDFRQCIIYDSNEPNAKLIGVEYIISAKLFQTLTEDEKKFWHSHIYEVKSGMLVCPFGSLVPTAVADKTEGKVMEDLINTYGKTWHFWQVDRGDPLPFGPPQLMMAFTGDNQLSPKALKNRDERLNVSTAHKKEARAQLHETYKRDPAADHWLARDDNTVYQCDMKLVEQKKIVQ
ncbi:12090_t:CDS:2, partial [Dentiscutata heterogama]